jgi:deoxyribodipyrimidine photo-lyase
MKTAIWWIRRDLRLSDNQALSAALAQAERVVPVYLLDRDSPDRPDVNKKRLAFLLGGLRMLDEDLRLLGSRLIVRSGDPKNELETLLAETGASAIFALEEYAPQSIERDTLVAKVLPLQLLRGLTIHPPDAIRQANGEPVAVLTPFGKAWKSLPLPSVRDVLPPPASLTPPPDVGSLSIPAEPTLSSSVPFLPGEVEAQRRLQAFVDGIAGGSSGCEAPIYCYDAVRNRLDIDGTSKLSPYLGLGMLSARQAVVSALSAIDAAQDAGAEYSAQLWLEALVRREFAISIQYYFPKALEQGLRPEFRNMPWENDRNALDAWAEGRTGFPLVDAAMRQLVQTGWVHNRARLVVASFLTKDLLVDWQWGERFFAQHLLDGDLAASNEGWQRAAGTGTGAAPYLDILNPSLQARKHDPEGTFVRRWVPELTRVPTRYIHQPWSMPADVQRESACVIGQDYPAPILDHGWARERAMEFFRNARQPIKTY